MHTVSTLRHKWMALLLVVSVMLSGCAGLTLQDQIAGLMKEGQQLYSEKKYDQALGKFGQVIEKDPAYWQAYLWAARSFIAMGNWNDAIANGKKAFDLAPKGQDVIPVFAEALFGGGSDALKNGHFAESIRHFVEFLKIEPGNARTWLNVGKAYFGQKQFREGLGALVQGLAAGSSAQRADLIRELREGGVQAFSDGKYRESVDLLKEFLKYDAKNLSAYLSLAKAYWESGDHGDALNTFRKVLELDPRQEEALRYLLRR